VDDSVKFKTNLDPALAGNETLRVEEVGVVANHIAWIMQDVTA